MFDSVLSFAKDVRESFTPVLKDTAFTTEGVLTPTEFIAAGDKLIAVCPSWKWAGGEARKRKDYLPEERQYLVMKGCACYRRVTELDSATSVDRMISLRPSKSAASGSVCGGRKKGHDGDDDEWCAPSFKAPVGTTGDTKAEDGFEVVDRVEAVASGSSGSSSSSSDNQQQKADDDDDEYADMEDDTLALDGATASAASPSSAGPGADNAGGVNSGTNPSQQHGQPQQQVLRARRYDCYITYDKYYRTPRIWLFGHSEDGSPLRRDEAFEDVMQDYARKTVTVEPHPHLPDLPCVGIHPCQHASAMLNIVRSLQACGRAPPRPDQSLFIFLKFIQSVVPTIEYDFTMDVSAA